MTPEALAAILDRAAEYGEVGQFGGGREVDYDDLFDALEKDLDVDLGTDTSVPLFDKIRRSYRTAYREANG